MEKNAEITIYTDGSKSKGGTGAGVLILKKHGEDQSYQCKLPDNKNVTSAEITAIREAGKRIIDMEIEGKNITLISDSKNALNRLNSNKVKCSILRETIQIWKEVSITNCVKFRWTRSHANCQGNLMADYLAKQGVQCNLMGVEKRVSLREVCQALKHESSQQWDAEWQSDPTYCRQTKLWMPIPDYKKNWAVIEARPIHSLKGYPTNHWFQ